MELGIANVAAITVLVYLIAAGIKATPLDNKWLPVICGVAGIILGLAALYFDMPDFPAHDPINAAAIGAVSGLAATGINQIGKQLTKPDYPDDTEDY